MSSRPLIYSPLPARTTFRYILPAFNVPAHPLGPHFHRQVRIAGAMQLFPLLAIYSHVTGWKGNSPEWKLEIKSLNLQFIRVSWLQVFIIMLTWIIKMKQGKSYKHKKSYVSRTRKMTNETAVEKRFQPVWERYKIDSGVVIRIAEKGERGRKKKTTQQLQNFSFFLLLKYSCCTILYRLQVYNIVIHNY